MAQRPANIPVDELRKLAILNPTVEEIAAYFGVSKPTAIKYLKRKAYKEALEQGKSNRKTSLKRYQWQAAAKGNTAMLIFLGKNELGQRDKIEQDIAVNGTYTVRHDPPPRAQTLEEWSADRRRQVQEALEA